jgi:hypothetical protein
MATKATSTAASEIVPRNTYRKSLAIINEDTTDSLYVKREGAETLSVSSTDHDWKITPGGALSFNSLVDGMEAVQARYTVVASANTPRIAYFETEDVKR